MTLLDEGSATPAAAADAPTAAPAAAAKAAAPPASAAAAAAPTAAATGADEPGLPEARRILKELMALVQWARGGRARQVWT